MRVPPRVYFFVWSTVKGKILTTDNLRKGVLLFGLVYNVQI